MHFAFRFIFVRFVSPAVFVLTAALALIAALLPHKAWAHDPLEPSLSAVTVHSTREDLQGMATAASEGVVTLKQLRSRPVLRAGDLMEAVPGLVATQHAGEGKANQYYLRGFNLDHGTDLVTFVDGVPVNLPTHAHGQGYTDLGFLIPELIESVQYRKGPYAAEDGDFAAAGAVRMSTVRKVNHPFGQLELGGGHYRRALVGGSLDIGSLYLGAGDLLLAGEQLRDDGPWAVKQNLRQTKLLGKYTQGSRLNGWSVGATHYQAAWVSSDQLPQRAVDSGLVGRFGTLDPTTGGQTRRMGLNASWIDTDKDRQTKFSAYVLRYDFELFSQFTYFTNGCDQAPLPAACNGASALDQFAQVDRRNALGLNASHRAPFTLAGFDGMVTLGTDLRRDNIGQIALYDTAARMRLNTVRDDRVTVNALGLWGQGEWQLTPALRGITGLRWDKRVLGVNTVNSANSGTATAAIISPKVTLAYSVNPNLDLYANWGRGFHSNDARGVMAKVDPRDTATPVSAATALVRATGYEIGTRAKVSDTLSVTAALWALKLNSELVFVGDAGTTQASRPSARKGLEVTSTWRPTARLDVDADLSLSRARYIDADLLGSHIPGAMERVASVSATYQAGPWILGGRVRHFGSRALTEDNSLRGSASTLVNLKSAYRLNANAELTLEAFNLFNRSANDTEYAYASRLPGEAAFTSAAPATLHFHPSLPRTVRVGLKLWL
jgi:outer membrane receptor protein involved in Fe transport